jgi:hypothetical protein
MGSSPRPRSRTMTATRVLLLIFCGSCDAPPGGPVSAEPLAYDADRDVHNDRSGCAHNSAPHWVLRDSDGKRVKALIEPRCGQEHSDADQECIPLDFGASDSFPCVRVIDHEGRYVNVLYELSSGQMDACQGLTYGKSYPSWESIYGVNYLNAECEGERYYSAMYGDGYYFPEFTAGREFISVEGKLWYPSEQNCLDDVSVVWSLIEGECSDSPQAETLCPMRRVPEWAENLLPNPPYTLAVEYEANTP